MDKFKVSISCTFGGEWFKKILIAQSKVLKKCLKFVMLMENPKFSIKYIAYS